MPKFLSRLLVIAVAGLVGVAFLTTAYRAFHAADYSDCDNLAGGCLRLRQQYALRAGGAGSLIVGAASICLAVVVAWKGLSRWLMALLVLAAIAAITIFAVDPVGHLDNRYSGWLHGCPSRNDGC